MDFYEKILRVAGLVLNTKHLNTKNIDVSNLTASNYLADSGAHGHNGFRFLLELKTHWFYDQR